MNQDEAAELATAILRGLTRGLRGERASREDFETGQPGDPGEFFGDDLPGGETVEIIERERIVRITHQENTHERNSNRALEASHRIADRHAQIDTR